MRVRTRILMMLRVFRHHGTLRHSSSFIVGQPHSDAALNLRNPLPFLSIFSFLWSLPCIYFNPGRYHLFFFPLCICCNTAIIHEVLFNLIGTPFIYSIFSFFFLSLISYTAHAIWLSYSPCLILATREQLAVAQLACPLLALSSLLFPCCSLSLLGPIVHCTTSHLT